PPGGADHRRWHRPGTAGEPAQIRARRHRRGGNDRAALVGKRVQAHYWLALWLSGCSLKPANTRSGALVLCREGATRPAHSSLARAPLKAITPCSRQPPRLSSRTATRATSLLTSVTCMERSAANGRPVIGWSKAISRVWLD